MIKNKNIEKTITNEINSVKVNNYSMIFRLATTKM